MAHDNDYFRRSEKSRVDQGKLNQASDLYTVYRFNERCHSVKRCAVENEISFMKPTKQSNIFLWAAFLSCISRIARVDLVVRHNHNLKNESFGVTGLKAQIQETSQIPCNARLQLLRSPSLGMTREALLFDD